MTCTRISAIVVALSMSTPAARAQTPVAYRLTYASPGAAVVGVALTLPEPVPGPRVLVVPRAVPMGYSQQFYDRFVGNVRAYDSSGAALPATRVDGPRWSLGQAGRDVHRIEYEVDVRRMEREILSGGDSSRVRDDYLFVLGYSAFGYVDGYEVAVPVALEVVGPETWPVVSTLALPAAGSATGRVSASAADFYGLADSQVLMGRGMTVERVEGVSPGPLAVVIRAEFDVDRRRIATIAREAYERLIAYFGSAPFDGYTAVFEFLSPITPGHTYGFSMEHLQSATFCLGPERALTAGTNERDARLFGVNVAHHLAHAWIPKRASGRGYYPFSWEVAPALDSVWFSEGFGQYAAIDALADGLPVEQRAPYMDQVLDVRYRSTLRQMPRFLLEMPLEQLSYRGSFVYSEDFRVGRTLFSRGALMAADMDARIRDATRGERRLRDALRHLMAWSARHRRGFEIAELPAIFEEGTGVDTRDVLEKWLGPIRTP
jgi:predicted metalloprotease with PDZ domain